MRIADGRAGGALVVLAAGLAVASSLVLLGGLCGVLLDLGLSPAQAAIVSGASGFGLAGVIYACGVRCLATGGLTPAQALAQLRGEIEVAATAAAERRSRSPSAQMDGEAPR